MKPSKQQLEFLNWEFGAFFHFGIRTFYEGHKDWDGLDMPLEGFNPTALDCEDWIKNVKEAGAKYAILVCKHHDGFANWPSKYTDYAIQNTPYKSGKGDVVREFVDACRKYDLKVGLYYSPAQQNYESIPDEEYDDYFINQIGELLTGYGRIDYLWFDGCGSENHSYNTKRIIGEIRRMQPEILIFNMWDPDTRWAGNEAGLSPVDMEYVVNRVPFSEKTTEDDVLGEDMYLPPECDVTMRAYNWFYSDSDEDTVKTPEELMGLYYYSVGNGGNFLLNIGPDRRGLLPDKDKENLLAFGKELKRRFETPLDGTLTFAENEATVTFSKTTVVDHVVLAEDLLTDDFITDFDIFVVPPKSWNGGIKVYSGKTVGHKRIVQIPAIAVNAIEVKYRTKHGNGKLSDMKLYHARG
ncbi:MAG: alpha-L-fucosidase [Clostridia bacterium]|nr:alpha-L-fucosidase [Clostridia bacterium]